MPIPPNRFATHPPFLGSGRMLPWVLGILLAIALPAAAAPIWAEGGYDRASAAKVVLLPRMTGDAADREAQLLSKAQIPREIASLLEGDSKDRELAASKMLMREGWTPVEIRERVVKARERFKGMLVRPMSKGELDLLEKPVEADLLWLTADAYVSLSRPPEEVDGLTTGINLARSYGLTASGAKLAGETSLPVFQKWIAARPSHKAPLPLKGWVFALGAVLPILGVSAFRRAPLPVPPRVLVRSVLLGRLATSLVFLMFAVYIASVFFPGRLLASPGLSTALIVVGVAMLTPLFSEFLARSRLPLSPVFPRWFLSALAPQVAMVSLVLSGFVASSPVLGGILGLGFLTGSIAVLGWLSRARESSTPAVSKQALWGFSAVWCSMNLCFLFSSSEFAAEMWFPAVTRGAFPTPSILLASLVPTLFVLLGIVASLVSRALSSRGVSVTVDASPQRASLSGLLGALVIVSTVALVGGASSLAAPKQKPPSPSDPPPASWDEAYAAVKRGDGLIVDSRQPGTKPVVPEVANLDPDSDDASLMEFCAFASGKKLYVFCASSLCGISSELAARLRSVCKADAVHIEGGAEKWSPR